MKTRFVPFVALVLVLASTVGAPATSIVLGDISHAGRWHVDEHGRVVILRGVNMVAKLASDGYLPSRLGFDEDDAAFLASEGFNTVRLGIIHKGLEPTRGTYDDAYLDEIVGIARMLGAHGIRVLLDFHQDLFNERFNGEGFPDWAVQDDGLPAQPDGGFPANYFIMPALWRAYDHFWANDAVGPGDVGLQDAFAQAWRHVATRTKDEPSIFGYDVFNETWPGSQWTSCVNPAGCPLFDQLTLTPFYAKVFSAIRSTGADKMVYYETHPIFGGGGDVSIGDTGDDKAGFSFHVYCLGALFGAPPVSGAPDNASCPLGVDRPFERAEAQSDRTGDALLLTEFGATDDIPTLERDTAAADRWATSWHYWAYFGKDVCCARPNEGIIIDPSKPPAPENVKQAKLDVLARAYPRAVAGEPIGWSFDPTSGAFRFQYKTTPSIAAATEIVLPARHYPAGYQVQIAGPASIGSAPGARILELNASGAGTVTVEVKPVT